MPWSLCLVFEHRMQLRGAAKDLFDIVQGPIGRLRRVIVESKGQCMDVLGLLSREASFQARVATRRDASDARDSVLRPAAARRLKHVRARTSMPYPSHSAASTDSAHSRGAVCRDAPHAFYTLRVSGMRPTARRTAPRCVRRTHQPRRPTRRALATASAIRPGEPSEAAVSRDRGTNRTTDVPDPTLSVCVM